MNRLAWGAALEEHHDALDAYLDRVNALAEDEWTAKMPGRDWSPAEETLHLIKAYELPLGDGRMRMKVSPMMSWVLRTFYLRWLFWRRTFHRGARAPGEVRPDTDEAHSTPRDVMTRRLRITADKATLALWSAASERPSFRLVHAYFGPLTPLTGLRMLNAHTRHHTHD